jgi:hypothetical protein
MTDARARANPALWHVTGCTASHSEEQVRSHHVIAMTILRVASRREHRLRFLEANTLLTWEHLVFSSTFCTLHSSVPTLHIVEHDISTRSMTLTELPHLFIANRSKKLELTFGMILASLQSSY